FASSCLRWFQLDGLRTTAPLDFAARFHMLQRTKRAGRALGARRGQYPNADRETIETPGQTWARRGPDVGQTWARYGPDVGKIGAGCGRGPEALCTGPA